MGGHLVVFLPIIACPGPTKVLEETIQASWHWIRQRRFGFDTKGTESKRENGPTGLCENFKIVHIKRNYQQIKNEINRTG